MRIKAKAAFLILAIVFGNGLLFAHSHMMGMAVSDTDSGSLPCCNPAAAGPLGADFSDLPKTEATRLGIAGGVVVTNIHAGGTLSNQTKMHAGFIITRIGDLPVTSVAGLKYALGKQKSHFVIQGIYPGSKQVYYYSIHDF